MLPHGGRVGESVLKPSDVGIIMTYRCASACKHCLYNCGPGWKDWMDPETVTEALLATKHWTHPYRVHLTGGEPFHNIPLLKHAIREASRLGIHHYVETNAFWCTSKEKAVTVFSELKSDGLEQILISCSPFHAETIPPSRTFAAIEAAIEVFGPEGVQVYLPHCVRQLQLFDPARTTPISRYVERFGLEKAGRMLWDGYYIIPAGRSGYRLGFLTRRWPAEHFRGDDCRREILFAHHSHLDLYGNYISWFCGGLTIGSWRRMAQLIQDFQHGRYPTLVHALIDRGPFGLYEMASSSFGYVQDPGGYAGKCHLCVDVRRHLCSVSEWPELQPKAFYSNI